jgi:hypothetical protein
MNAGWLGLGVGVVLIVIAWVVLVFAPEFFADFNEALGSASAVLGFGVAAAGIFKGGEELIRTEMRWERVAATAGLVASGAILVLAGSIGA